MRIISLFVAFAMISSVVAQTPAPTGAPSTSPTTSPSYSPSVSPTGAPTMSPTWEQCAPGTFRNGTGCDPCEPGTFTDTVNATECDECAVGRFAPASGSDECTVCPVDTFQNETGKEFCYDCPDGYHAPSNESMTCLVAPTAAPSTSPTASPSASPTTAAPSTSPTTSPSTSPTTSPTMSPTRSPTEAALEVTKIFIHFNGSVCGSNAYEEFASTEMYECLADCDNDPLCVAVDTDEITCKKYNTSSYSKSATAEDVACFVKGDSSPLFSYNQNGTSDHECQGDNMFDDYFSDHILDVATVSKCRAFCNSQLECVGFTFTTDNGTDPQCVFFNNITGTVALTGDFEGRCEFKNELVMSEYVGHEETNCGPGTFTTVSSVDNGFYTCYQACEDEDVCEGFQFVDDTCKIFETVNLTVDGGDALCYKKSFGETRIGMHTGRLIFTEATFTAGVHDQEAFETYIADIIVDVIGVAVEITDVFEGSVVVDYLVEGSRPALTEQDNIFIMEVITEGGDTYNLGTQLVGGSNPPPPTTAPTGSPSASPTKAPTQSPTTAPTGSPSTSPTSRPTSSPVTSAPTTAAPVPFLHKRSAVKALEYTGYTLLGIDGVLIIYFTYLYFGGQPISYTRTSSLNMDF